jgi:hypothetical protein
MLAYLFWHRPAEGQERAGYEQALMTFHDRLESVTIPELVASGSARVGELPWTPGDGYEDWYLVEDFAALGVLNAAVVDDAHADAHDRVAHAARFGAGALYALQAGDPEMTGDHCAWVTKPAAWTTPSSSMAWHPIPPQAEAAAAETDGPRTGPRVPFDGRPPLLSSRGPSAGHRPAHRRRHRLSVPLTDRPRDTRPSPAIGASACFVLMSRLPALLVTVRGGTG